jgi:aminopeptidase-like protein
LEVRNVLNVLNLLDGENDTINICKVLSLSFEEVDKILRTLLEGEVIEIRG